jgi:asparagine synthase (glutamine-hydrolysing)
MCGIVGVVYQDRDRPVADGLVRSMCDAIRHRGPDDAGIHVRGNVGLGMRRLSVIDLEGGRQPIFNEDRSNVLVFNGEIYNYQELQRGLRARGHRLASRGDSETVIHLYEESGPGAMERLRGMFALAVWDERERTLLLARDRFGMKPLYVVTGAWGIAFASELKALRAVGLTGDDLDWSALDSYFHLGYIPAPATPFRGVRKLEPGHSLLWTESGSIRQERFWDLPLGREDSGGPDVRRRVRESIDESVEAHLVSDVPLAVFLSGGLDSSAVASSMALAGYRAHAYTARYHGSGAAALDESHLASLLVRRYGLDHTIVDIEPEVRDLMEPIVYALDEPHADESAVPTWLISRAVASEFKVALGGTGGDELFAGYRRHIGILLSELYGRVPGTVRRLASAAAQRLPEPSGAGLGVNRLKRFLSSGRGNLAERYVQLQDRFPGDRGSFYSPEVAARIHADPARDRFHHVWSDAGAPGGLRGALYLDYKTYLPDDLLHLGDRISMAHSLELRVPFVDHELVEALFTLPARTQVGALRNKHLLKQALAPRLPREHLRAVKRGFIGPTASWLRNELRDMLLDELSAARMNRLGYFSAQGVDRLLDDHFSRRHNREGVLWALLCFSIWHRQFMEAPVAAGAADRFTAVEAEQVQA